MSRFNETRSFDDRPRIFAELHPESQHHDTANGHGLGLSIVTSPVDRLAVPKRLVSHRELRYTGEVLKSGSKTRMTGHGGA